MMHDVLGDLSPVHGDNILNGGNLGCVVIGRLRRRNSMQVEAERILSQAPARLPGMPTGAKAAGLHCGGSISAWNASR
jgi:hypothetical protein